MSISPLAVYSVVGLGGGQHPDGRPEPLANRHFGPHFEPTEGPVTLAQDTHPGRGVVLPAALLFLGCDRQEAVGDKEQFDGLLEDAPRSGDPRPIPAQEGPSASKRADDDPRRLKAIVARLEDLFSVNLATIKHLLKRQGYTWRRVRRGLKSKRDEAAFR